MTTTLPPPDDCGHNMRITTLRRFVYTVQSLASSNLDGLEMEHVSLCSEQQRKRIPWHIMTRRPYRLAPRSGWPHRKRSGGREYHVSPKTNTAKTDIRFGLVVDE
jgi:hypothetical protein